MLQFHVRKWVATPFGTGMERIHVDDPVPMSLGLKSKIDLLSTVFFTPHYVPRYDPEPVMLSLGVNTALESSVQSICLFAFFVTHNNRL